MASADPTHVHEKAPTLAAKLERQRSVLAGLVSTRKNFIDVAVQEILDCVPADAKSRVEGKLEEIRLHSEELGSYRDIELEIEVEGERQRRLSARSPADEAADEVFDDPSEYPAARGAASTHIPLHEILADSSGAESDPLSDDEKAGQSARNFTDRIRAVQEQGDDLLEKMRAMLK